MEPSQTAALIMAASARATARVNGMLAENSVRWRAGLPIAFGHEDFVNVIEQEGISRDAIMAILTHSSMNQVPLAATASKSLSKTAHAAIDPKTTSSPGVS